MRCIGQLDVPFRPSHNFRSRTLGAVALGALCVLVAPPVRAAIELVGQQEVTLEWTPASGPVVGYRIYVAVDGGAPTYYGSVFNTNRGTIEGSFGTTIEVSVAGLDAAGVEGPISTPSPAIEFVADPPADDGPPPPPIDPPPPNDPPPPPTDDDDPSGDDPGPEPTDPPPAAPTALDFDGDGIADLLLRNRKSGALVLWSMDGSSVVAEQRLGTLPTASKIVGTDDYDGDTIADVVLLDEDTGLLELWRPAFEAWNQRTTLAEGVNAGWAVVGSGDFDGDGRADLLLRNEAELAVEIWFFDATGGLDVLAIADAPRRSWKLAGTRDFDADGAAEILWHKRRTGELRLWHIDAAGIIEVPFGNVPPRARLHGVGDLDGDGREDLTLEFAGALHVALTGAAGPGAPQPLLDLGGSGDLAASGDYDGDGLTDLVVRLGVKRSHELWFMEGAQPAAVEPLPDLQPRWEVASPLD